VVAHVVGGSSTNQPGLFSGTTERGVMTSPKLPLKGLNWSFPRRAFIYPTFSFVQPAVLVGKNTCGFTEKQ